MAEIECSGCGEIRYITKKFRITRLPMCDDCIKKVVDEHVNSILEIDWEKEERERKERENENQQNSDS